MNLIYNKKMIKDNKYENRLIKLDMIQHEINYLIKEKQRKELKENSKVKKIKNKSQMRKKHQELLKLSETINKRLKNRNYGVI